MLKLQEVIHTPQINYSIKNDKLNIESLSDAYQQEINYRKNDLEKESAISVFRKLSVSPEITIEQLLQHLKINPKLWDGISSLYAHDFCKILLGVEKTKSTVSNTPEKVKRTKLSVQQSTEIKHLIMNTLRGFPGGLTRIHLIDKFDKQALKVLGMTANELNSKIHRLLIDLVREKKLHKTGEKKGVRYIPTDTQSIIS
jgi:hypothetical protein